MRGDGDNHTITFGVGFMGDPAMKQFVGEERWLAEQEASQKEQREAEEALAVKQQEAADEAAFWAARYGELPSKRTPADVIREVSEKADIADRRQAREQRELDAKILNGEVIVPGMTEMPLSSLLVLAEARAAKAARDAAPATKGDLKAAKDPMIKALAKSVSGLLWERDRKKY